MKLLVQIARIIVGVLFIFSGFVKIVDPIGSQYKFEEYFSEAVLNLEFLIPYALPFAIFLIIAEIILGVALLVGWRAKFTINSLKIIILFCTIMGCKIIFIIFRLTRFIKCISNSKCF
ncbi:MAG: DoxX family protein [Polaribacter sp.]